MVGTEPYSVTGRALPVRLGRENPYEHRTWSRNGTAAMVSEHFWLSFLPQLLHVQVPVRGLAEGGGPRPRRPPMAGACTHGAKGFHGRRRIKMNAGRGVEAIGRTRQGDADEARGRGGARRHDQAR